MSAAKEKLDLSCFPDNFRDEYEEIVHDILRLEAKYHQFNREVVLWLSKEIVAEDGMAPGPGRKARRNQQADVGHRMLVLMAALRELQVPLVFDSQLNVPRGENE